MATELARQEKRDVAAGSRTLIEGVVPSGLKEFRMTYSTDDWPVEAAGTVVFTFFLVRGVRDPVALWEDTVAYKRANKRATTQVVGAALDGLIPVDSTIRVTVDGPALRTSSVLEGE